MKKLIYYLPYIPVMGIFIVLSNRDHNLCIFHGHHEGNTWKDHINHKFHHLVSAIIQGISIPLILWTIYKILE